MIHFIPSPAEIPQITQHKGLLVPGFREVGLSDGMEASAAASERGGHTSAPIPPSSLSLPLAGIVPFDGCCDFAFAFLPSVGRLVGRSVGWGLEGRSWEAIYKRAT